MFHYECDHTSPTPTKLTQFGLSTSGHTQSKGAVLHAIFPWQLSSSTKPHKRHQLFTSRDLMIKEPCNLIGQEPIES